MKKTTLALLIGLASTVALAGQVVHAGQGKKDFPVAWTSHNPSDISYYQNSSSNQLATIIVTVAQTDNDPINPTKPDGAIVTCGILPPVHLAPGGIYGCQIGTPTNPGTTVSWADDGSGKNPNGSWGTYTIN